MPTKQSDRKVQLRELGNRHQELENRLKKVKDPTLAKELKLAKLNLKDKMASMGASV